MAADRTFILLPGIAQNAIKAIEQLPSDGSMQVTVGLKKKVRGIDANAAMWAGPLRDISEQAWYGGRQYSAEMWHEIFKRMYLPEDDLEDLDRHVTNKWTGKWDMLPSGDRVLAGSTTTLSAYGMGQYMEQICAFATTELGVRLHIK